MSDCATMIARRYESPIGALLLLAENGSLRAVLWPDDDPKRAGIHGDVDRPVTPADQTALDQTVLDQTAQQLDEYFAGTRQRFDVPIDGGGTDFQRAAWAGLQEIPYGETRTYGQQASAIGRPSAVRAIGAANGRNPLSIVVPCHRVIGADGSLTGFAGGIDVKRRLLDHEARHRADSLGAGTLF